MAGIGLSKRKFFTTGQIARICGVSIATVQKWVDSGELGSFRIPITAVDRRVPRETLLAFMKKYKVPTDELEPKEHYRVLIAEDDTAYRKQLERIMGDMNKPVKVETVTDGIQALVRAGELKPNLIVLNLRIPGMDSLKMIEFLKTSTEWKGTKTVVLSELTAEEKAKLEELNTDSIIPKPATPQQLKKSLLNIAGAA